MKKSDLLIEEQIARSVIKDLPTDILSSAKAFFDSYNRYKKLNKLYTTYINGPKEALKNTGNGKIYVDYNIDGTVTGRMSNSGVTVSGKKLGISFHTLPREKEELEVNIRNIVIAPSNWDFITADVAGAELRYLAHIANEKKMIEAFLSGIDLHTYSASMTFGKPTDKITKEERQIAKAVSFLTIYGGTAYTLANKQGISEDRANLIISSWMSAYPGIPKYMQIVRDYINQHKYAITLFGRRRNLPNIDSPVKSIAESAFRQGLNFTIQSPTSDIVACCIIGVYNELKKRKLKGRLYGTVHDSLEVVCPKDETNEVISVIREEMTNYNYARNELGVSLRVPFKVDIEVGTSFGNGVKITTS